MWDFMMILVYVPIVLIWYVIHHRFTRSLRQRMRALLLLDILEASVEAGKNVEQVIVDLSKNEDRPLGDKHTKLASYIEAGHSLSSALSKVPGFLPQQICDALSAGEKAKDMNRIVKACRNMITDAYSQSRGTVNRTVLTMISLVCLTAAGYLVVFIVPQYAKIFVELELSLPKSTQALIVFSNTVRTHAIFSFSMMVILYLISRILSGKSRLLRFLPMRIASISDRISIAIPWRRNNMIRDFSAVLSTLLDVEMPEQEAVLLAGKCAGNSIFFERTQSAAELLAEGTCLVKALALVDPAGELKWRMKNATRQGCDFSAALNGWHQALEARSVYQKNIVIDVAGTSMIVAIGLGVAFIAMACFLPIFWLLSAIT